MAQKEKGIESLNGSTNYRQNMQKASGTDTDHPRQGDSNEYPQHILLWRTKENYPLIITKYHP